MDEQTYTIEVATVEGVGDSEFLDRLAAVVYERPALADPLLSLEPDGAVTASFCVAGTDPLRAAQSAIEHFVRAVAAARPLCPSPVRGPAATVERFAVTPTEARERALA